jgi:hypothetical protein
MSYYDINLAFLYSPNISTKSSIFNFQPSTFNLQLSTFNLQLSAFNFQLSTFNLQPSTFNLQLSTFSFQPSTFSFQLSTFSFQPSIPSARSFYHKALHTGKHFYSIIISTTAPQCKHFESFTFILPILSPYLWIIIFPQL